MGKEGWIKWFSELRNKDVNIAGVKGANLGEMHNNKFPVPPGFVVTTEAFEYFVEKSDLKEEINSILKEIDVENRDELEEGSKKITDLIINSKIPEDLKEEIVDAYDVLDVDKNRFSGAAEGALDILRNSHEPPFVAIRSSVSSKDLESSSFSGQHDSFLNVKGNDELLRSVKKTFASLFSARAIYYKKKKGFSPGFETAMGVVVQKMIDSQKSGVAFSKDPMNASGDRNMFIEAVWGLGNGISSGKIAGDCYFIDKEYNVVGKKIVDKEVALTRNSSGKTEEVKLNPEISKREVLTGHELKILSGIVRRLEEHYESPRNVKFSFDKDGVHLLHGGAITSEPRIGDSELEGNVLFSGHGVSAGVSSGTVKIIKNSEDLKKVHRGNVVVVESPMNDLAVTLQNSVAIISEKGGMGSQVAVVSREMGIPAVFNAKNATEKLKDGQVVTVDGFTGRIIEGQGVERKVEVKKILKTERIKIKTIIDLPDYAPRAAESGADSVGLVRLESVISENGKHPYWYINNNKIDEYIKSIHEGLRKIALSFNNIWIRSANFKSDEYNNLEGAPKWLEVNPMLGYQGIRFSLKNQDLLEAEFKAIKELADEYENKKFGIILSKIVSVDEVKESKKVAERVGMPENVRMGVMIETPAAVQIINALCEEGIDFVNLGINDLTQYTLAIDRNNESVKDLYDEMNPAILNSIRYVLRRCNKYSVETSICIDPLMTGATGEEMVRFLIGEGVKSITVRPDEAYEISKIISENEAENIEREGEIDEGLNKDEVREKVENIKEVGKEEDLEEAILKALEDGEKSEEYNPGIVDSEGGIKGKKDVPELNESIPVGSEHFDLGENSEEIGDIRGGKKDLEIELPEEDILETEIDDNEIGGNVFETQEDNALEVEAKMEAETSEKREAAMAQLFGEQKKEKKEGEDEALDIF